MDFCDKCGGMVIVKEGKAICAACGHKMNKKPKLEASEKIQKHEAIAVIKEDEENTYPIVEIKCPNCKNNKSYFWTQQTRSSDESETKFYRCVKCKHSWRKYR